MTKEQAYCCLNCTASPNCCGICGECPECCKDCGDMSGCNSSAYFKDGVFYLDYISVYSTSMNRNYSDLSCSYTGNINFTSTYFSKTNKCIVNGSSYYNSCCDDGDGAHTQSLCSGDTCYGGGCDNNENCWFGNDCKGKCDESCMGTSPNNCSNVCVDDTCGSFNHGCIGLGCVCSQEEIDDGDCEGIYENVNNGNITFQNVAQLYNSKGEIVDPTFIGASYDPCAPCATWSAGCHFFSV